MININKISLGIKTSTTMFRVTSLAGQIIDDILSTQGNKHFTDNYYLKVSTTIDTGAFALINKESGNFLSVKRNEIIFTKDGYKQPNKSISISNTIKEFSFIWNILNNQLKVGNVRRIGIVTEHQIKKNNASKLLIDLLTNFPSSAHPGRFLLSFEDRQPDKKDIALDINESAFTNTIYNFYDSTLDAQNPTEDAINMNLDFQKYYAPPISSNINDQINKLSKKFEGEERQFNELLRNKGLI